jgi:hypothetical protein
MHAQIRMEEERRGKEVKGRKEKQEKNKNTNMRITELVNDRGFNLSVVHFIYNFQYIK